MSNDVADHVASLDTRTAEDSVRTTATLHRT
jgi:hypothetical protein